ncbi:MAG: pyridoxine 5'-phosphate synthase [Gemmataceae bacterium]
MIRLNVNIDHVATVRQARRAAEPDPVFAAALAVLGGADGITVHLREDRRHIQDRDLDLLRSTLTCRLNLEMAATAEMQAIALRVRPAEATLVPEKREELTTEGGLDVVRHAQTVGPVVTNLRNAGIEVSLFIDPHSAQIHMAQQLGAQAVELQTATYSEAKTPAQQAEQLQLLTVAAQQAHELGLHVHLGHGLNYHNTQAVCRLPHLVELNIGHSIVSRAVLVGMKQAVADMKELIIRSISR